MRPSIHNRFNVPDLALNKDKQNHALLILSCADDHLVVCARLRYCFPHFHVEINYLGEELVIKVEKYTHQLLF